MVYNRRLKNNEEFYNPAIISIIPKTTDQNWFTIFPWVRVDTLCFILNKYVLKELEIKLRYKNLVYILIKNKNFSLKYNKNKKILEALIKLHEKFKSEIDFINEINKIWIDPCYKIEILYLIFTVESYKAL